MSNREPVTIAAYLQSGFNGSTLAATLISYLASAVLITPLCFLLLRWIGEDYTLKCLPFFVFACIVVEFIVYKRLMPPSYGQPGKQDLPSTSVTSINELPIPHSDKETNAIDCEKRAEQQQERSVRRLLTVAYAAAGLVFVVAALKYGDWILFLPGCFLLGVSAKSITREVQSAGHQEDGDAKPQ